MQHSNDGEGRVMAQNPSAFEGYHRLRHACRPQDSSSQVVTPTTHVNPSPAVTFIHDIGFPKQLGKE